MTLGNYLVIAAFLVLLSFLTIQITGIHYAGIHLRGRLPIIKIHYITGKIAIFSTWALFILKALYPSIGYINPPDYLQWAGIACLYSGTFFVISGIREMGLSLRFGLPEERTSLKTKRIYRLTRNPVYSGMMLITTGSCFFFPDLLNVVFSLYGIIIHHRIIRAEERYLTEQFGMEYIVYQARVSRYL